MNYAKTKVYFDGSHFIGIPKTKQPWKRRKKPRTPILKDKNKEVFEKVYNENIHKPKKEKIESITKELEKEFDNKEQVKTFIQENFDRKKRNLIERRKRLVRKVNLQE